MRQAPRKAFQGGGRYRRPQAWIDHVIATDPALRRVRLAAQPRFSSRLRVYGRAALAQPSIPAGTAIGRKSLVSRRELLDTIIHEELHHRLHERACCGSDIALRRVADRDLEEEYVREAAARFLRLRGA
jgi:hypothetical protein